MSTDLPAAPQAAEPPAAPKKKSPVRAIVIAVVALLVVGGGGYAAYRYFNNDATQAKAGDCAKVTGTESAPQYVATACDAADANVTVAKALPKSTDSCGGDYLEYIQTLGKDSSSGVKLCLMPKLEEGQCYKIDDSTSVEFPKQPCSAENIKVAKIVKGSTDQAACGETGAPMTFPEPPTTFCLEPGAA